MIGTTRRGSAWLRAAVLCVGVAIAVGGRALTASDGGTVLKFKQNIFGSDTGYYEVDGYNGPSPTIDIEVGQKYVFDQSDPSNWYHPLGFAYKPDGAHGCLADDYGGCPEVEHEGLQYFCDDKPCTLDEYEPAFQVPREEWLIHKYRVELTPTKDDASQTSELFYFCHLHRGMSGLLRLFENGNPVPQTGAEVELYAPYIPSEFDAMCGTYEVADYAPDQKFREQCGETEFLCGNNLNSPFSKCMRAINCKMNRQMRVVNSDNPVVTFMHQMIPHHDNAVNMAKILMKLNDTQAEKGDGGPPLLDADTEELLWNIVNEQNEQITFMNTWLEENGYQPFDKRGGASTDRIYLCPPVSH